MVDAVGRKIEIGKAANKKQKSGKQKAESRNLSAKGAIHISLGHRPRNMGQT